MVRPLALVLLAALAAGCQQHNLTRSSDALEAAAPCCASAAELPYQPAELDKELDLALLDTSPVFLFPEGRRFFQAVALPAWSGPLQLTVYSDVARSFRGNTGVVRPTVRLYDAQYRTTRVITADPDRHWQGLRFEMTVFINEENRGERYLAIYAQDAPGDGSQTAQEYTPVQVGHGLLLVPVTVGAVTHERNHVYSPTGPLRLKVRAYQPVVAGERERDGG